MTYFRLTVFLACILCWGCDETIRNIAGNPEEVTPPTPSTSVVPYDINQDGFDLLANMQGHWVGINRVINIDYDWFAFDYRPISPSHIFGIFEGGTMGNLLTSFFITDFKNTRTIMARNGGLLNGIYRTSYFVLDSVKADNNGKYYRLVDAKGGAATMFMELRFQQDSLFFNAYTSRLGLNGLPTRHMTFKAKKQNLALAQTAANTVGFPQNIPAVDFSNGLPEELFYVNAGASEPKSASFLALGDSTDNVITIAPQSGDPFTIIDHPYLSYLQIDIVQNPLIENRTLFLNLSKDPLTDNNGFLMFNAFNSVLLFPELVPNTEDFLVTYLHPGTYYLTIIADASGDGFI